MNQKAVEALGDYTDFYTLQAQRLQKFGIEIDGLDSNHRSKQNGLAETHSENASEGELQCKNICSQSSLGLG